jgi:D-glycero-alpha-D-manno-heptose-7-phosphate kinase
VVGLIKEWLRLPLTDYEIAQTACQVERVDVGIKGGLQDQYACTFGGVNLIEFKGSSVTVNPLRVAQHYLNELRYRLLLCFTGRTRLSANILSRQVDAYQRGDEQVLSTLEQMKSLTSQMKDCLLKGQIEEFGHYLHLSWEHKKKLDQAITDPSIDRMYQVASEAGALGGKILGAGGGGYLLLFCRFDRRKSVAEAVEALGAEVVEFTLDPFGLQTWTVNEQ